MNGEKEDEMEVTDVRSFVEGILGSRLNMGAERGGNKKTYLPTSDLWSAQRDLEGGYNFQN